MKTKTCTKCKKIKPIIEFNKDKNYKDGYKNWCKQCVKEYLHNKCSCGRTKSKYAKMCASCFHRSRIGIKRLPFSLTTCKKMSISRKKLFKKGYINPFKNKKHSKKTKKLMSKNHSNVKEKNNPMFGKKGKLAPNFGRNFSQEHKHKLKLQAIKRWKNSEYREKMTGRNSSAYGKIRHGKGAYYKNIWMRSSYEVLFAQFLDLSGIKYKYESKTFDLGNSTYTPDFYIPEWNLYIEVKGWWRDDAKKKFKAFKKLYKNVKIKIIDCKKLKNWGIL